MTSSILPLNLVRKAVRTVWRYEVGVRPRNLALAREKGLSLTWDEKNRLHLLKRDGTLQATAQLPVSLEAACSADDGSACAAVGKDGGVWWLAPDLSVRWRKDIPHPAMSAALDPFAQYLAVGDARGYVYLFDRHGRAVWEAQSPRPLHHLAFIPAAPFLLGSADFGLVACFDATGRCVWLDGLVANVGSLAVSGDGERIILACFTEGLQGYTAGGSNLGRVHITEPCRLAAMSFDGRLSLVAGLSHTLLLLDAKSQILCEHRLEKPAVGIALDALGETAVVALAHGLVLGLDLTQPAAP